MDMVCSDGIAEADRRSVLRAKNRACTPRMNLFVIRVLDINDSMRRGIEGAIL